MDSVFDLCRLRASAPPGRGRGERGQRRLGRRLPAPRHGPSVRDDQGGGRAHDARPGGGMGEGRHPRERRRAVVHPDAARGAGSEDPGAPRRRSWPRRPSAGSASRRRSPRVVAFLCMPAASYITGQCDRHRRRIQRGRRFPINPLAIRPAAAILRHPFLAQSFRRDDHSWLRRRGRRPTAGGKGRAKKVVAAKQEGRAEEGSAAPEAAKEDRPAPKAAPKASEARRKGNRRRRSRPRNAAPKREGQAGGEGRAKKSSPPTSACENSRRRSPPKAAKARRSSSPSRRRQAQRPPKAAPRRRSRCAPPRAAAPAAPAAPARVPPRRRRSAAAAPVRASTRAARPPRPGCRPRSRVRHRSSPRPPRAEAPSAIAAPPASSDRLIRPDDVASSGRPHRAGAHRRRAGRRPLLRHRQPDGSHGARRRRHRVGLPLHRRRRRDGRRDRRSSSSKPSPFTQSVFRTRKPGGARPHRQISGGALPRPPASAFSTPCARSIRSRRSWRTRRSG